MNIIEVKDKYQYNNFIKQQEHSQFLQSFEWGEFQKSAGNKIVRLCINDNGKIKFAFTLIKKSLPLGMNYFYVPRICVKYLSEKEFVFLFKEIKKIAKKEKCIFLRFEPLNQLRITNYELRITKTIDIQPSKTLILSISKPEEELLKQMHQKTRYNIKLSDKKGVEVRVIKDIDKYFDEFWQLMSQTETRDGFRLHGKNYYKKMLKHNNKFIKLIVAFYNKKILCVNIVSFFGNMATYVHGASSNENRNLMAPYALQWYTIKLLKEYGAKK